MKVRVSVRGLKMCLVAQGQMYFQNAFVRPINSRADLRICTYMHAAVRNFLTQ